MGIYERVLESKIKGMNWKKMAYLVSLVSCQCLCAVFWPFQRDLVGFRFADFLFLYIERKSANLKPTKSR